MEQQKNTGKVSVLVVDDNSANVFVLATMLRQMGFEADEAGSGMEAVNNTCQKNYDLILMDYIMPEMNGIETIKQILFISKGKKVPAIVGISATLEPEVIEAFESAGVSEVIPKPVKKEDIVRIMQRFGFYALWQDAEEENTKIDITSVLSQVQGLDYHKGIDLMAGSAENYMRVLDVCIKNISENATAIELIQDSSQLDQFVLHFHSLKGIFLNIGADGIAEFSKELEFAAREGNLTLIHAKVPDYLAKVNTLNMQLKNANDMYAAQCRQQNKTEDVSESELMQMLEKLGQHIEDFEYIEITEVVEKILASTSGEIKSAVEKINDAVQDFDYERAAQAVADLKKRIL